MINALGELSVILPLSVAPVILISGVGLILLSLTNRYGRIIDRSRILAGTIRELGTSNRATQLSAELSILLRRAKISRTAIGLAVLSLFFTAMLVLSLFIMSLLNVDLSSLSIILFIACLVSFSISLIFFILDINLSLKALEVETEI